MLGYTPPEGGNSYNYNNITEYNLPHRRSKKDLLRYDKELWWQRVILSCSDSSDSIRLLFSSLALPSSY